LPLYNIGHLRSCKLLHRSLDDTYLITTADDRYVPRAYRAGRRSLPHIRYELDLLVHLNRSGVPVSIPVAVRDGGDMRVLPAPEGGVTIELGTAVGGDPPSDRP